MPPGCTAERPYGMSDPSLDRLEGAPPTLLVRVPMESPWSSKPLRPFASFAPFAVKSIYPPSPPPRHGERRRVPALSRSRATPWALKPAPAGR